MVDFYIGQVGIDPEKFWINTWKENALLGEAYTIQNNLWWEMTRFVSTMIVNQNATKKSQMVQPHKLFSLPQDVMLDHGSPKSTPEQMKKFLNKINKQSE